MTDFADLPLEVLNAVCELHYADDPDVEIIDGGIHDTDSLHGHNTVEEMSGAE